MMKFFAKDYDKHFLWKVIFPSLIIAAIIQAFLYLKGYYSFSGDESDRTLLAYSWLIDQMPKGEPWLPFHTIINGIILKYFFNLFWVPRIVGSIFGLLSVSAIIWLSHILIKEKVVTIISAIIAVFFPPFVILRAVPLSEVMYFFFIIIGSAFLFNWIENKRTKYIIFAVIFFAFSSTVRYEGWIFSDCTIIYLFIEYYINRKPKIFIILILAFILLAFPIFWILKNAYDTGNPLEFIISSSERYKIHYGFSIIPMLKYNLITQFIYQNILYLNFIGLISLLFYLLTDRKFRRFSIIFFLSFLFLAILSILGLAMPSHAYWRIPLIWNILLIPFTAHFILKFSLFLAEIVKKNKRIVLATIIFVFVFYFSYQVKRIITFSYFSPDDISAGNFLKEYVISENGDFKILIDTSDWNYTNVMVASNYPKNFILNANKDPALPVDQIISIDKKINESYLSNMKICYLLFEEPHLKELIGGNPDFVKIKKFEDWELFKLK